MFNNIKWLPGETLLKNLVDFDLSFRIFQNAIKLKDPKMNKTNSIYRQKNHPV